MPRPSGTNSVSSSQVQSWVNQGADLRAVLGKILARDNRPLSSAVTQTLEKAFASQPGDFFQATPSSGGNSSGGSTILSLSSQPEFSAIAAGRGSLKKGAQGAAVTLLQAALNALGFSIPNPVPNFGPKTKAAVVAFQTAHPSTGTPDGVVGKKTLAALDAALLGMGGIPGGGGSSGSNGTTEDLAAVLVDLNKNLLFLNTAVIDPQAVQNLPQTLRAMETNSSRAAIEGIIHSIEVGTGVMDDLQKGEIVSERSLGLPDSDSNLSLFRVFRVANGEVVDGKSLTPPGKYTVGGSRTNREAKKYFVPDGFNVNPANPYGIFFLELMRNGRYSRRGIHGTVHNANWPRLSDGKRSVSHGCVRTQNPDNVRLAQYLKRGDNVVIKEATGYVRDTSLIA